MSVGIINIWVRDRDFRSLGRGSPALKQTLERLAWFCPNLEGSSVFPKVQTLADALGVTIRTVQYNLRRLEELGFIAVAEEARGHVPRIYQIDVDKILSFPLTETGQRQRDKEVFAMRDKYAPEEPKDHKTQGVQTTSEDESPQTPRGAKSTDPGCKVREPGVQSPPSSIEEGLHQESEEGLSARASAPGPDGGPDANALAAPLVSQLWRDHLSELEALPSWPLLKRCIPDANDGETMTLAIESPVIGFAVLAFARQEAEAILGLRIACRVRYWVEPALFERKHGRKQAARASRHRRDGEIVTLDDKPWRLWCYHAAEIEALPYAQSKVLTQCYPDDYAGDRLFLCCASSAHATALYEAAGEAIAKVLGVRIKPQIFFPLELVIAARAAIAADELTAVNS